MPLVPTASPAQVRSLDLREIQNVGLEAQRLGELLN